MFSTSELSIAQKYPFTSIARAVVKDNIKDFSEISSEIRERAKVMVNAAMLGNPYMPQLTSSKELMTNEIVAFPVAKIYVSSSSSEEVYRKFSRFFARNTFELLEKEKDSVIFDIASELGLGYYPSDKGSFSSMPLFDFLKVSFTQNEQFMKLVNQKLESGKVFLKRNDFIRVVAAAAFENIYSSLPVNLSLVPKQLKTEGKALTESRVSSFKFTGYGKFASINPEFFPPCYAELYSKLLSGSSIQHIARFDLAVFLAALGMKKEPLKELFSKAPNYDEKKTSYHLDRIFSKGKFLSASCAKLKEHGLCNAECRVRNPVHYYRNRAGLKK